MRLCCRTIVAISLYLASALALAAEPLPRSVLIFDQSDTNAVWGLGFRSTFRSEVLKGSKTSVAIYSEVLELGRFNSPQYQELLRTFLREKYRDRPIGVVVVHGSLALEVFMRLRADVWPSAPVVIAFVQPQDLTRLSLPPDITGTTSQLEFRNVTKTARALVPSLKRIALVGTRYDKDPFRTHFMQELSAFGSELELIDLLDLPLAEAAKRIATLPEDTVVYYSNLYAVGSDPSLILADVVPLLSEASNRPIISDNSFHIGLGSTGGNVALVEPIAVESARRVLRILDGEPAASMPITAVDFTRPIFDWRQLKRWNISEANLPPGSEIRFRTPGLWEQYRWHLIAIFSAILLQAVVISVLLVERRRRSLAEIEAGRRRREVIHLNRVATATVLSSSIAHELNQPLGAILINTETARQLLRAVPPDLSQIGEILSDIARDDQRANEILQRQGGLLKKGHDGNSQVLDLNSSVADVVDMAGPEARKRGIVLSVGRTSGVLPVRTDPIQMQQVILNLVMNGMDALVDCDASARKLTIETSRSRGTMAEVAVSDSGKGIPDDRLARIFDAFFTTKPQGTGLGLPIARTIIETYGGTIWAENRAGGGAAFHFRLPLAEARS